MIYWFTGQPGAGKTTLAKALIEDCADECFHIDGDNMREMFKNTDYTREGRIKNFNQILNLIKFLEAKNYTIVVSMVSPFKEMRDKLKKETDVTEIYVHTTEIRGREHYFAEYYDAPTEDFIDMDTTDISVEECLAKIPYNKIGKPYSMFIGRWQPLHDGHKWLVSQRLDLGKDVLICIRDMKTDDKNPYTAREVKANVEDYYKKEISEGRIKVIIIPNIESVNYGRKVGYDVIEHVPPTDIGAISATKIREQLNVKTQKSNS